MLDKPARYLIRVRGHLAPSWSDRLGGMTIRIDNESEPPTATLTGDLVDQSALSGVISALIDLKQTVISVERLS